jgi:hypothetical protein
MTFTGTIDDINAALNDMLLRGSRQVRRAGERAGVTDQGNSGGGGPLTAADAVAVTVVSMATPRRVRTSEVTTLEDTPYTFGTADPGSAAQRHAARQLAGGVHRHAAHCRFVDR